MQLLLLLLDYIENISETLSPRLLPTRRRRLPVYVGPVCVSRQRDAAGLL